MKLYEIVPGKIYTRGEPRANHAREILAGNFSVVSLTTRPNPHLADLPRVYHLPLPDGRVTSRHLATAKFVAELAKQAPVIVHCHAGRNRAAFVAALAAIELGYYKDGVAALKGVRAIRKNAIANPHFEEALRAI